MRPRVLHTALRVAAAVHPVSGAALFLTDIPRGVEGGSANRAAR